MPIETNETVIQHIFSAMNPKWVTWCVRRSPGAQMRSDRWELCLDCQGDENAIPEGFILPKMSPEEQDIRVKIFVRGRPPKQTLRYAKDFNSSAADPLVNAQPPPPPPGPKPIAMPPPTTLHAATPPPTTTHAVTQTSSTTYAATLPPTTDDPLALTAQPVTPAATPAAMPRATPGATPNAPPLAQPHTPSTRPRPTPSPNEAQPFFKRGRGPQGRGNRASNDSYAQAQAEYEERLAQRLASLERMEADCIKETKGSRRKRQERNADPAGRTIETFFYKSPRV